MKACAVFCDFDGTVTSRDVGYNLFHHFSHGESDKLLPDWKSGRLSTRDCLILEARMVRAGSEEIYRFLDQFELQRGFVEFESLCRLNGIDLVIVSDGLDFYIHYLLSRYGLGHLPVIANHGRLENEGVVVEFVHENRTCRRCGSCKGERIREYRARRPDETRIVFVGDGYSDTCAVREADIVFAKKDLERFCLENDISYYRYDDFFGVATQLAALGVLTGG